jgi:predicted permease
MTSAMRSLQIFRKHWKLSAIAVFSLSVAMALGILSLSISNTALLLPLAAPEADRLVMIYTRAPGEAIGGISYPDYEYFRRNNDVFSDIAAVPNAIGINATFNSDNHQEVRVVTRPVSDRYFAVLGIRPYLGRLFTPGDDDSKSAIAVMTYFCWKRLGSDPKIVGKQITGRTIVGVAPPSFTGSFYGVEGDLFTPLGSTDADVRSRARRDDRQFRLLARLKPGISRRQAQAEMGGLSGQLASAYPKEDKGRVAIVTRATLLPPDALPDAELMIGILMGLVLLVLLIACANVANLLLAVAVGRRQEAAIKLALGAPRGRLIREFLRESAILCSIGAALGYLAADALIARFSSITIQLPSFGAYTIGLNLRLDATVAAFALALTAIAIVATGVAPALYASSPALSQMLVGEIVVGGTRKNARRGALVAIEVAVCTLVLVGMGLCQRSLYNLRHADPGFSARNLIALQLFPKDEGISEAKAKVLIDAARRAVSSLAGVESVALATNLPLLYCCNETPVQFPDGSKKIPVKQTTVDTGYFASLGIRVLSGRVFTAGDRENSPEVVVVNRKMADMFWPGQSAVGQTIQAGDPPRRAMVVGVVADGKYESLDEDPKPCIYYSLSQHFQIRSTLVARTKGDPHLWSGPLSRAVSEAGFMVIFPPVTYDRWADLSLLAERYTAAGVAGLSGLGLMLAVAGIFGAISYSVSERKKELGIRVALGARPWQLLRLVLRQTLVIAGSGITAGLLLGVAVTVLLRSQFYGIGAVEWTVLLPVSAAMVGISLLVAYFSARAWLTVDPMEAVRHA